MGENSVAIVKMPSNFRSGKGAVTEAAIRVAILRALYISLLSVLRCCWSRGDLRTSFSLV